jgi:glutathione S-transferase
MSLPTLWQFKCSHFSEKVRWTLDWKGIAHKHVSLQPGWYMLPSLVNSRQPQVPLLRSEGRTLKTVRGSSSTLKQHTPRGPYIPANRHLHASRPVR